MSLPSAERIEELRFHAERGDGQSATNAEMLALLDAAFTLRRLEVWRAGKALEGWRMVRAFEDGTNLIVHLDEGDESGARTSGGESPDLLAALKSALDAAEKS